MFLPSLKIHYLNIYKFIKLNINNVNESLFILTCEIFLFISFKNIL